MFVVFTGFLSCTEKDLLDKVLSGVAFGCCCDEHLDLSDCFLVGEVLVKPVGR